LAFIIDYRYGNYTIAATDAHKYTALRMRYFPVHNMEYEEWYMEFYDYYRVR